METIGREASLGLGFRGFRFAFRGGAPGFVVWDLGCRFYGLGLLVGFKNIQHSCLVYCQALHLLQDTGCL